jgi:hypothetical protein
MKRLKVYGGMPLNKDHIQERAVAAVFNQKELAELTGCSLYEIRGWWCETGNKEELEKALANPHKLIWMGRY